MSAVAESKRENTICPGRESTDQCLLNRRNITLTGKDIRRGKQNKYMDCIGSGVNKAKYLTRAIKDQVANSDGTFHMHRQDMLEGSISLQRCRGINRISSK